MEPRGHHAMTHEPARDHPSLLSHWCSGIEATCAMWCKHDHSPVRTALRHAQSENKRLWKQLILVYLVRLYCLLAVVYTCKWCTRIFYRVIFNPMNTTDHTNAGAKLYSFRIVPVKYRHNVTNKLFILSQYHRSIIHLRNGAWLSCDVVHDVAICSQWNLGTQYARRPCTRLEDVML